MKERREAKKKPVSEWKAADIDFGSPTTLKLELIRLYTPEMTTGECAFITADTPEEAGRQLARRLKEDQII